MSLVGGGGAMPAISKSLKAVQAQIVSIKTATVQSDYALLTETVIILDDDPFSVPLTVPTLTTPLPRFARVFVMTFPPQGMVILGTVTEPLPEPAPFVASQAIYPASTTITAADALGATSILLEVVGGGGAGGGAASGAAASGVSSAGSGGGAAGYDRAVIPTAGLTFPLQVNIAAAGTGVSDADGNAGGTTTVIDNNGAGATLVSATGGAAGRRSPSTPATIGPMFAGGLGGTGSTVVGVRGGPGGQSVRITALQSLAGDGGSSQFGGGGVPPNSANTAGGNSVAYGGGGSGARSSNGGGSFAGGNGSAGLVIATFL